MLATLFLVGSALLGAGLVRRVFGGVLSFAEQLLWGLVVGWALATCAAYMAARTAGQLSAGTLAAPVAATCAVAALLWLPEAMRLWRRGLSPSSIAATSRSLWSHDHAGLLIIAALFTPLYARLFRAGVLYRGAGGIYTTGNDDIGFHLAVINSFLYGRNFPPLYTPFPPSTLLYPFMPDFQTAALCALGMSVESALALTGFVLALAGTGIFYTLALRIVRALRMSGGYDRLAAALATALFYFNGGLGFLYLFGDWRRSHLGLAEFMLGLKTDYTYFGESHVQWANLTADILLPQRTALYGIPLASMVFTLFVATWDRPPEKMSEAVPWDGWRLLLIAGLLTGLLPYFHTHTYLGLGLISGLLFLIRPRRAWLVFWAASLLPAIPFLFALRGHVAADGFVRFEPGWLNHGESNWVVYWVRNVGLPTLLIIPAWLSAPPLWRRFYVAFVGLLVFALLVVVSPNDFDNIKLMYYWYALTCVFVAAWLVRLAFARRLRLLALALVLASVASGLLAIYVQGRSPRLIFTDAQVAAADFVREHTSPRALFLEAPAPMQPVLSLAGRPVLLGDITLVWSHGYDFASREADVRRIYAGSSDAAELLRYYDVDYVYLGERERQELRANQKFFDTTFPVFYRGAGITIYDVRVPGAQPGEAMRRLASLPPREFASRVGKDPYQMLVEFPRAFFAVYRYYKVAYGRMPRYAEMKGYMELVGRGVYVGAPEWESALERNKAALTEAWCDGPEFKVLYGGKTDAEYIETLYANAGLTPVRGTRDEIVARLSDGRETRASALREVAESKKIYEREYDTAYVLAHFYGYLRRNPDDPPDGNMDGLRFWVEGLGRSGDYRNVTRAFDGSAEYRSRDFSSE
jgi:hypothetical protein